MKISLGFSPCPNDTFIFDALIHHKIDTEGLEFEVFFEDVETLNQKALNAQLDVTKLSFHALAYANDRYELLDAGSALGSGVGPLLICKDKNLRSNTENLPAGLRIGIPGKYTTANFLLGIAFPHLIRKKEMLFSDIEAGLVNNEIDLGLIIHENRFTYQDKGLYKVIDLGDFWEQLTGCPIPLGGIVINRNLEKGLKEKVNRLLRQSVEYAFANPASGIEFIRQHAQEMTDDVMYKHIELYVNDYSVNLGNKGREAINVLFEMAEKKGLIPPITQNIFLS